MIAQHASGRAFAKDKVLCGWDRARREPAHIVMSGHSAVQLANQVPHLYRCRFSISSVFGSPADTMRVRL